MLLLKRHLVELVRAGKKRQTVRLWSRALLRAGQISYTPGLGKMLITAVDELPGLEALTEADAVADGFKNLRELLAEIHRIYGARIPPGRSVFRIKFDWPVEGEVAGGKAAKSAVVKSQPRPNIKESRPRSAATSSRESIPVQTPLPASPADIRGGMTPNQREKLRAFVLAKAPG